MVALALGAYQALVVIPANRKSTAPTDHTED
jgi:hypothetical protein